MAYKKLEFYSLSALLAGVCILMFFIFQPFLSALLLAIIFATTFAPIHKRFLAITRESRGFAAFLSTMFVLVVIGVPVTLLSIQIFKESTQLYSSLTDTGGTAGLSQGIEGAVRSMGIPSLPNGTLNVSQYVKGGLSWLIQNLGTFFSNVAKIMLDVFILLVALFYLFKDGDKLKKSIIVLSPIRNIYDELIFHKLELAINSVVRGSIAVGIVHGLLTTIGLALFGVPNPVLWGSIAIFLSLVPGVGIALILIPAALFLFSGGATTPAIGLFIWWIVQANLVDNILKPKIVGRGMKLHPLLILLSIVGGISFFGLLGFLFGPLVLSLLFAFLEVFSSLRKENNS